MKHPIDRLKRTIGDLLRNRALLERCKDQTPHEVAGHVTVLLRENGIPVQKIEVKPLPPDQDCKYCVSYELKDSGERQAQRFFRRH